MGMIIKNISLLFFFMDYKGDIGFKIIGLRVRKFVRLSLTNI
jgi:hypothetical protein